MFRLLSVTLLVLAGALLPFGGITAQEERPVVVLEVDGAISPASDDYFRRNLRKAEELDARLIVLRMNTPGGLDSAMRSMIREILTSPIPVATYVAPSGSRAASAGTYILYASHIAAMAPATNLGSATPVQIGGGGAPDEGEDEEGPLDELRERMEEERPDEDEEDEAVEEEVPQPEQNGLTAMERKVINDAVAYIRGLANMRGRNADWAEKAVREAVNITSDEALELNVIDLVASDLDDLLAQIHGREIEIMGQVVTLDTEGAPVEVLEPDWRNELLAVISDPNVAYILMLLGVYGLFFELANPGFIAPGVIGAISLVLALFAFQVLPINYAGLGLILLGIAFMIGEIFMPSFGIMGIGGVAAFVAGSILLIDTDAAGYGISLPLVISMAAVSALFFFAVASLAAKAWRRPVVSGREDLAHAHAEAMQDFEESGRVWVQGESWRAVTDKPVRKGQRLRVVEVEGLQLRVTPEGDAAAESDGKEH